MQRFWIDIVALSVAGLCMATPAQATTAAEQVAAYAAQAGERGDATRGQAFFTQKHGGKWSCASCHNAPPNTNGRHANTGKTLLPLAPAFNPERFSDPRKVEKWFRRNCNDVLERECSAREKADVMTYLLNIR